MGIASIGFIVSFSHEFSIYLSIVFSLLLIIPLSGFRGFLIQNFDLSTLDRNKYTTINRFVINHSHHKNEQIQAGKEFLFKGKYICTGCYGILTGSIVSIIVMFYYLIGEIVKQNLNLFLIIIPLFFLPIIIRYSIWITMPTIPKFFSNVMLPIACSGLLLLVDYYFMNWWINTIAIYLVIGIIYLRSYISLKDTKNIQCDSNKTNNMTFG